MKKSFVGPQIVFCRSPVGYHCSTRIQLKLANVFYSVTRSKWGGEGKGKIQFVVFVVCQFCKMTFSKIVFLIPNFVGFVPEIFLFS